MDWRPVCGLTPADSGSIVELVLAQTITIAAHLEHQEEQDQRAAALGGLSALL